MWLGLTSKLQAFRAKTVSRFPVTSTLHSPQTKRVQRQHGPRGKSECSWPAVGRSRAREMPWLRSSCVRQRAPLQPRVYILVPGFHHKQPRPSSVEWTTDRLPRLGGRAYPQGHPAPTLLAGDWGDGAGCLSLPGVEFPKLSPCHRARQNPRKPLTQHWWT